MILENIEYSDKYNLVRLTISSEKFYVDYDFYHELSLDLDKEIDFKTYKEILACDDYNRAKNFALNKISYSQKTTYEIKQKLREKNFSTDSIDRVIEFLDSYGFLDDEAYVKSYIRDKDEISMWPRKKIAFMLRRKHIADDIIDKYISEVDDSRELEKASFFADKKIRDDFSFENKQKVFRHLASKGFDIDIINSIINERFV